MQVWVTVRVELGQIVSISKYRDTTCHIGIKLSKYQLDSSIISLYLYIVFWHLNSLCRLPNIHDSLNASDLELQRRYRVSNTTFSGIVRYRSNYGIVQALTGSVLFLPISVANPASHCTGCWD